MGSAIVGRNLSRGVMHTATTTSNPSHSGRQPTSALPTHPAAMADEEPLSIYDEIEIEDMTFDDTLQVYHYPCPCGDRFEISIGDLREGDEIAVCPSCSLMIRVVFDVVSQPADRACSFVSGWRLMQVLSV
jgi:diphthamide biosynthesis protein 3